MYTAKDDILLLSDGTRREGAPDKEDDDDVVEANPRSSAWSQKGGHVAIGSS